MMDLAVQLPGFLSSGFRVASEAIERRPERQPARRRAVEHLRRRARHRRACSPTCSTRPWWLWAACWVIAAVAVLRGK
jgi:hypothetical protein